MSDLALRLVLWAVVTIGCGIASQRAGADDATSFPPARLEPSIILRHAGDYRQVRERVQRAIDAGARSVNFVVTINCRLDDQDRVVEYGLSDPRNGGWSFRPMSPEVHEEILQACRAGIALAAEANMELAFLGHLDAHTTPYVWRNKFDFDPTEQIGGYSYDSLLLQPVFQLATEVAPDQAIDFSLAGEMGTSVFTYPAAYHEILKRLQQQAGERTAPTKFGISLNHSGVQGSFVNEGDPTHVALLQRLFAGLDFIGFSNYHAVNVPPTAEDFTRSVQDFAAQMAAQEVPLSDEALIHFSEIAVGGYGPEGRTTDPRVAAQTLWEGTANPQRSPWADDGMLKFRRQYHEALLAFLRDQPANWPVEVAYLWSEGSWDPQGISARTFVDDELMTAIRTHNDVCMRAKVPAP